MKKWILTSALALLSLGAQSCSQIDEVKGDVTIVPNVNPASLTRIDRYINQHFRKIYNVRINYRYDNKATDRRYLLGVIKENKALQFLNVIDFLFFEAFAQGAPKGYVQEHTVKYLYLFGTSGYAIDRRMAGAAPQGTIWLYNINELTDKITADDIPGLKDHFISTLYHESAHTLHEERAYPREYDRLSALEYQKQNAFVYWYKTGKSAAYAGFVSDYASTDADEDFAELFATYVLSTDEEWEAILTKAEGRNRPEATLTGRQIIETKLKIMKKYLTDEYKTDIDKIRAEALRRLALVPSMDFSQFPANY